MWEEIVYLNGAHILHGFISPCYNKSTHACATVRAQPLPTLELFMWEAMGEGPRVPFELFVCGRQWERG